MKNIRIAYWLLFLLCAASVQSADFNVTAPISASAYTINGNSNPPLTLTRGQTYTFAINAHSIHPFEIVDTSFNPYNNGVQNNNISQGTITFVVPMTAPSQLRYWCSVHGFGGIISIVGGADFNVTAPGEASVYTINGNANPTLTLTRGQTYTFAIDADSIHPFEIIDNNFTPYNNGLSTNNIYQGTITFVVPMTAPSQLRYWCSIHAFGGIINIVGGPGQDFNISTPGGVGAYTVNNLSGENPPLTIARGDIYVFEVDAAGDHPVIFLESLNPWQPYNSGVVNNDTAQGRILFSVPANAPSTLYYVCSFHGFFGVINVVDGPLPVRVTSLSIGSTVVTVKSLSLNGWNAVPEYTSNLLSPTWTVVPSFTNAYANGTNTTTFNRLEPICGPNVFLRVKNK